MLKSACMVVHSYCPDDPRVRREAEALAATGIGVDVLCLRGENEAREEVVAGVRYIRLPVQRKRGGIVRYLFEYTAFFLLAFFMTSWLAIRNRYDLFQAHNMPDVLVLCGLVPRLLGSKVILDLHDLVPEVYIAKYDLADNSWVVKILCFVERFCVGCADIAITTSIAFRRTMIERGIDEKKIKIVLNAPDESIFPEREATLPAGDGPMRLIFHGTVVHRSGLDFALRAMEIVKDDFPGLTLDVVGGGDALADCETLAGKLGLADRVTFHGQRPISEVPGHVENADVGLVPNRKNLFTEKNLPTRIFEYLRMGKPVIVARTPGVEDYFGGDSLLYFTPEDPQDLARALRRLRDETAEVGDILARGKAIYDNHRWSVERQHYVELLTALCG